MRRRQQRPLGRVLPPSAGETSSVGSTKRRRQTRVFGESSGAARILLLASVGLVAMQLFRWTFTKRLAKTQRRKPNGAVFPQTRNAISRIGSRNPKANRNARLESFALARRFWLANDGPISVSNQSLVLVW